MVLWQIKEARESGESGSPEVVPIIEQDLCIGCSSCVNACQEGVLEIVAGKSTVMNLAACTGASTCTEVCPTGACQLGGKGGFRKVEVPQIDGNFETNQKGIYAIGELGGLGLIKNAVIEGTLVVEKIRETHQPSEGVTDLIIVGAGPAGLSAALAAKEAGLSSILFEQGSFANTIRRFPNRKIVMAEPVQIPLYGSLWISDAPKETLLSVWGTIIESAGIQIMEHERVTHVERTPSERLQVQTTKGVYEGANVILALGKRGMPNELKVSGSDLPKLLYQLTDAAEYTHQEILVVGGGDSACEAAIGLSKQLGNRVTLSYRKDKFTRLKEKNLKALKECVEHGSTQLLFNSQVQTIGEKEVVIQNGELLRLPNDYVFAFLGGTSPRGFLEKIGIPMVTKEVQMEGSEREECDS